MRWIKDFYKQFNVKLRWRKDMYCGGFANTQTRTVTLNKKIFNKKTTDDNYKLSLVMHELCHILCIDNKKYINYHKQKNKKLVRLTGLKAERYVDRMSQKMLKSFFPELQGDMSYYRSISKKWYTDNYLNKYFKTSKG